MLVTIVVAFVAGFFVGNGVPYHVAGSTGEGVNRSPFPDRPRVNVIVGSIAIATGAIAWSFVDVAAQPWAAYVSAGVGALVVALIHAANWRNDPWRKHTADGSDSPSQ